MSKHGIPVTSPTRRSDAIHMMGSQQHASSGSSSRHTGASKGSTSGKQDPKNKDQMKQGASDKSSGQMGDQSTEKPASNQQGSSNKSDGAQDRRGQQGNDA